MVNHDCSPNARVVFDSQLNATLLAKCDIAEGKTATYNKVLRLFHKSINVAMIKILPSQIELKRRLSKYRYQIFLKMNVSTI